MPDPVDFVPVHLLVRRRRHKLLCVHLAFLLLGRFDKFSCKERPRGSLPAFAWDNVSVPIRPITGWPLLFPLSSTRIPVGLPCGLLSLSGGIRAYRVPLEYQSGLDPSFPPVAVCSRYRTRNPIFQLRAFWLEPVSIFGSSHITVFIGSSHSLVLSLEPSSHPP